MPRAHAALLLLIHAGIVLSTCPHVDPTLLPWSSPSTWPEDLPPLIDTEVVIPVDSGVLLDTQPPRLASLTIPPNSRLVWDDTGDYQLQIKFLLIRGGKSKLTFRLTIKLDR